MDPITEEITNLVIGTDIADRDDLIEVGRRALLDYLGAALAARKEPAVQRTAALVARRPGPVKLLGQDVKSFPEYAAFFDGFESHYLDFDDAQANIMGHGSTVIFSALLPLADRKDTMADFLSAYTAGMELEGLLGKRVNPAHKLHGWHPTATLGPIGAAAAIARLRRLDAGDTAQLLSLAATESAGLGLEAGTDTKPLHSGFAARNAVWAYFLLKEARLTSSLEAFNAEDGWGAVVGGVRLEPGSFSKEWLKPGQLLSPGLWMKEHQNCSAAIPGNNAVKALYAEGLRLENLSRMIFHFPPGKSYSLHYHHPKTGQEARFSLEFAAWDILTYGDIRDEDFLLPELPRSFEESLPKFSIAEDLPPASQEVRRIVVTADTKDGKHLTKEIPQAPGSPENPLSIEALTAKLAIGTDRSYAAALAAAIEKAENVGEILEKLGEQ